MHDPMVYILEESLEAIENGVLTRTQCLERYPEYRRELAALLDMALILRSAKVPSPNPAYFKAGKARLIAQIKQEQQVTLFDRWSNFVRALTPISLKKQALSLVLLVALLFVMMGGGTLYASARALPGDALYPVKTSVEDLRLVLTGDEGDSELYVQFAAIRLEEIQALIAAGREQDLTTALQGFEENLLSASQMLENPKPEDEDWAEQKAAHLESRIDHHIAILQSILQRAPEPAKPGLRRAIDVASLKRERLQEHWLGENPPGPSGAEEPSETTTGKPVGTGKPTDLPSGRPATVGKPQDTGKPQNTGKPEDTGKPENTGKPEDTGKPENTGKPEDTGKPENTGKPDDTGKPPDTPGGKPEDKEEKVKEEKEK